MKSLESKKDSSVCERIINNKFIREAIGEFRDIHDQAISVFIHVSIEMFADKLSMGHIVGLNTGSYVRMDDRDEISINTYNVKITRKRHTRIVFENLGREEFYVAGTAALLSNKEMLDIFQKSYLDFIRYDLANILHKASDFVKEKVPNNFLYAETMQKFEEIFGPMPRY